ncbi:MAG: 30S ribosomal protein S3 [Candidatus Doudnabacteria bacterium]|nr:30S ribosomal protein S3 [Candidatus Doudnabacteria bacterium]
MGHKINPTSLRLKITDTWKSRWFSKANYSKQLAEDVKIREYLELHLKKAGLVRIDIERLNDGTITVIIKTTKPGLIIGKGGAGIEELKKKIKAKLGIKQELKVNIEDIKEVNLQAQVIANGIAEQLEKRVAFRKLMKQSLEQMMNAGAKGAKVAIGGRLNGADIARTEHLSSGKIPLHTLRANIDFARSTAFTTYGTVGVKIWIYKGDVFESKKTFVKDIADAPKKA